MSKEGSSPLRAGTIPPSAILENFDPVADAVAVPFAPGRFLLPTKGEYLVKKITM